MYTSEIAVIGCAGGSPFDHTTDLKAAGYQLGAGVNGARLSALHVEKWMVLSHHYGVYTSLIDSKIVKTAGHGNIRAEDCGHSLAQSMDFVIPADHRVARVCGESGVFSMAAGAPCLNFLQLEVTPVLEPGLRVITSIGDCSRSSAERRRVGTHDRCRVVDIPQGLTLAGIAGRGGDSWDQVRLFVCPWLPEGGAWSPAVHTHLLPPFKQQVRALLLSLNALQQSANIKPLHHSDTEKIVAALFEVTFLGGQGDQQQQPQQQVVASQPQEAGSSAAASAAAGAAASARAARAARRASRGAAAGGRGAAPVAHTDYIAAWMEQQVAAARRASEQDC